MCRAALRCCGETEGNVTIMSGPESRGSRPVEMVLFFTFAISHASRERACADATCAGLVPSIAVEVALRGSVG